MLAYQKGDSAAFEVLYLRHKNGLFNFVYKSCQNTQLVEDIAHDVWAAIIRGIDHYRPMAKFRTYLYQIARNKLIDHWRKDKEDQQDDSNIELLSGKSGNENVTDPENSVLIAELMSAMAKLPEEQRIALLLGEEGFSQQEIAQITDSKQETVKSRVRYARQQLRTMMEVSP